MKTDRPMAGAEEIAAIMLDPVMLRRLLHIASLALEVAGQPHTVPWCECAYCAARNDLDRAARKLEALG